MQTIKNLKNIGVDEAIGLAIIIGAAGLFVFGLVLVSLFAVFAVTAIIELPWFYTAGVLAGLATLVGVLVWK